MKIASKSTEYVSVTLNINNIIDRVFDNEFEINLVGFVEVYEELYR